LAKDVEIISKLAANARLLMEQVEIEMEIILHWQK
jgi:hypothetical protein